MCSPPLILAVDDSPENLGLLCERLQAEGYAVRTAGDGAVALAHAAPDVLARLERDFYAPSSRSTTTASLPKTARRSPAGA